MAEDYTKLYLAALNEFHDVEQQYQNDTSTAAVIALSRAKDKFVRTISSLLQLRLKSVQDADGSTESQGLAKLAGTLSHENVPGENQALAQMIVARANAPGNENDPVLQSAKSQAEQYLDANPVTPTPQASAGAATPPGVPDQGVRPPAPSAAEQNKPSRSLHTTIDESDRYANVEGPPSWEPTVYDVNPGSLPPSTTSSGVIAAASAQSAVRPLYAANSQNYLPSGQYSRNAVNNNSMLFTGYRTTSSSRMDEDNPFQSRIYTNMKTPSFQSVDAMKNALGRTDLGFPDIRSFQKAMGLPETGIIDDNTQKTWLGILQGAANNTSTGHNTTWQQSFNATASWIAAQKAALARAQAAAYRVDETTSAAIVGGATKEMLGRLSTAQEDQAFHSAFSRAYAQSQGRVDAQQFARDWIREKHPTEAGTQLGQDYYGAMYDVLTSGPGSLGAEAAGVNG